MNHNEPVSSHARLVGCFNPFLRHSHCRQWGESSQVNTMAASRWAAKTLHASPKSENQRATHKNLPLTEKKTNISQRTRYIAPQFYCLLHEASNSKNSFSFLFSVASESGLLLLCLTFAFCWICDILWPTLATHQHTSTNHTAIICHPCGPAWAAHWEAKICKNLKILEVMEPLEVATPEHSSSGRA